MITQLKFALNDIISRPFSFIFSFIQITASLLLIAFSFSTISSLLEFKSSFDIFQNTSEVYFICDNTDDEYFMELIQTDEANTQNKIYELYTYINNLDSISTYTFESNNTDITDNCTLDNVEATYTDEYGSLYNLLYINSDFADFYNLQCDSGKMFADTDYMQTDTKTPVILGYNFKEYFEIGDEIIQDCIVVGFLKEGSYYLDPKSYGEILSLNNTILMPMIITSESHIGDIDTALTSMTIFTSDTNSLNAIKQKSDEIGVYDISFSSYSEQLGRIIEETVSEISIVLAIIFIVLFFCIICLISTMINFIETHKKEFTVHMLCGARKTDFVFRIIWQIALIILTSNILTFIIYKFSYASAFTFIVSIILLTIILLMPIVKIRNLSITELLKRSE